MRKIGIMGGTFNPIHIGHLMLAEWAREAAALEEVWIIPTGISYMKAEKDILPGRERLHMACLATGNNRYLKCLDIEIEREGYTYSYETLEQLNREYRDCRFYFIEGADCLFSMENWKHPEKIFQNAAIIAAVRGSMPMERLQEKRKELIGRFGGEILLLPFLNFSISSSEIRERIRKGLSVRYMVPEKVLSYIKEKGLYLEDEG